MKRQRAPFVSGLRGEDTELVVQVGLAKLRAASAWAAKQADDARPHATPRFDGCERIPADPDAAATVEAGDTIRRLIEGLLAEHGMAQRAARMVRR